MCLDWWISLVLFKAVIQLNFVFVLVPFGMYWLGYEHGISGKRFDPCLNYLLQESLSQCHGGRSVSQLRCLMLGQKNNSPSQVCPPTTCCLEMSCVCKQSLEVGAPGEIAYCSWWLLNKSPHVGRSLSWRFSKGSWVFITTGLFWLPRPLNTRTWMCSSDSFMSAFIYHFQGLTL